MIELSCRCGTNRKRFKYDLGTEFYIEECCEKAGFDHLGRQKLAEGERVDLSGLEQAQLEEVAAQASLNTPLGPKPSMAAALKAAIGLKPGRGKLRDMTRDQLIKLALEKKLEVKEGATKNELIALILG